MNSLPDPGRTILGPGQWGSFALSTGGLGRAARSPRAREAAWLPEAASVSEPSRASAFPYLTHRDPSRGRARLPDACDGGLLHLLVGAALA